MGIPRPTSLPFQKPWLRPAFRAGTTDHGACRKCGSALPALVEADYKFLGKPLNPRAAPGRVRDAQAEGSARLISGSKATKDGGWSEYPEPIDNSHGWLEELLLVPGPTGPFPAWSSILSQGQRIRLAVARRLGRRSIGIELNPEVRSSLHAVGASHVHPAAPSPTAEAQA